MVCMLILYPATLLNAVINSQFSSVAQSCPTLCNPMNRSTPGLPVHHQLPEFTQTLQLKEIFFQTWCLLYFSYMNTAVHLLLSRTHSYSKITKTNVMSIESVMPSSHLIFCRPLLLLPPILPSIRVFSNESTLHMRWPKYWNFSFSISPSKEHPGLISFRMHWLDLLTIKGTLKSLLQHHSSKASIHFDIWQN